ncbi:MAG: hypothetical protein J0G95_10450 [Rhizobiales bacterium]|nr:hypothetical protein [Hyphomicrobiales bacterium]
MPVRHPQTTDDDRRVVKFQRPAEPPPARPADSRNSAGPSDPVLRDAPARDPRRASDDYRRRIIANLAAAAFAIILAAIGVWLATSLTHMRQTQDCAMMGLRDCSRLTGSSPNS